MIDPESILNDVRERYLSLESYSDAGTVEKVDADQSGRRRLSEFETYFVRPAKFRFECRGLPDAVIEDLSNECTIWSNGKESYVRFFGRTEKSEDLSITVGGASAISGGSVQVILPLLLPIQIGKAWLDLKDPRLLSEEEVNGFRCHHFIFSNVRQNDTEVWIRKNDLMVLRLRRKTEVAKEDMDAHLAEGLEMIKSPWFEEMFHKTKDNIFAAPMLKLMGNDHHFLKALEQLKNTSLPEIKEMLSRSGVYDKMRPLLSPGNCWTEYSFTEVTINKPIADKLFTYDPQSKDDN
jgi:hypothetical protein